MNTHRWKREKETATSPAFLSPLKGPCPPPPPLPTPPRWWVCHRLLVFCCFSMFYFYAIGIKSSGTQGRLSCSRLFLSSSSIRLHLTWYCWLFHIALLSIWILSILSIRIPLTLNLVWRLTPTAQVLGQLRQEKATSLRSA